MAILNENYDFQRSASPEDRTAFRSQPRKTLFSPNTEFCRFVTAENPRTGEKGNQVFGSPWWFSKEIFRKLVNLADPKNLGIGDVARIGLAVPKQFNPKMEWIAIIYLTQSVYGWSGVAARQLASPAANIYLAGGLEQVFLPNLATAPSGMASDYARMRYFGMCPDHF